MNFSSRSHVFKDIILEYKLGHVDHILAFFFADRRIDRFSNDFCRSTAL
uniref:Uncharacterized protein n=1 Tax=Anguilla anguilla TaxID=7936 RepID=A0A0E9UIC2_ANGAN